MCAGDDNPPGYLESIEPPHYEPVSSGCCCRHGCRCACHVRRVRPPPPPPCQPYQTIRIRVYDFMWYDTFAESTVVLDEKGDLDLGMLAEKWAVWKLSPAFSDSTPDLLSSRDIAERIRRLGHVTLLECLPDEHIYGMDAHYSRPPPHKIRVRWYNSPFDTEFAETLERVGRLDAVPLARIARDHGFINACVFDVRDKKRYITKRVRALYTHERAAVMDPQGFLALTSKGAAAELPVKMPRKGLAFWLTILQRLMLMPPYKIFGFWHPFDSMFTISCEDYSSDAAYAQEAF